MFLLSYDLLKVVFKMLSLTRLTRICIVLIWAMGLTVPGVHADMLITYSYHYTIDLEQKQILLSSIREDAYMTECALREYIDKIGMAEIGKISYLDVDNIDLAQIVPPAEKIRLAFICTSGTLSPANEKERLFHKRDEN